MVVADEVEVVDVGGAEVAGPVFAVVGVTPAGWGVASGEHAAAVAGGDGAALRCGG